MIAAIFASVALIAAVVPAGDATDVRPLAAQTPAATPRPYQSRPDLARPDFQVNVSEPGIAPGDLFTSTDAGDIIYDNTGEPIWIRPVPDIFGHLDKIDWLGEDALVYMENPTPARGGVRGDWVVVDNTYTELARPEPKKGYVSDFHDITTTPEGTVILLIYVERVRDLTPYGGKSNASVTETIIQEIDIRTGNLLMEWEAWDHIPLTDSVVDLTGNEVDPFHANSIEVDIDGHLIVSMRHTDSIVKIDGDTGDVIWKLGGTSSDFDFVDDVGPSHQHDAHRRADGTISVFDNANSHGFGESRGVAWELDEVAGTATKITDLRRAAATFAPFMGSAQELPNGNTLLSFGPTGIATEFTETGVPVFETALGEVDRPFTYRTRRYEWSATPAEPPAVWVGDSAGDAAAATDASVYMSWNGATEHTDWEVLAGGDTASLESRGSGARTGFETVVDVTLEDTDRVLVARAKDAADAVLAESNPLDLTLCRGTDREIVTDFDGQGCDDIFTFTHGLAGDVYTAGAHPNNRFRKTARVHDWFAPRDEYPLTGDFNGDGFTDLITFLRGSSGDVWVALNNRNGGFEPSRVWHDWFAPFDEIPEIGDMNGDGRDDIITFLRGSAGDVWVAHSTGTSFGDSRLVHDWFAVGDEIPTTGDFNGDGYADLITFVQGLAGDVYVGLNDGDDGFEPSRVWHGWFAILDEIPDTGDMNGDGRDDIITFLRGSSGDAYAALSTGDGFGKADKVHEWFAPFDEIPGTGDFNGDGFTDLITFLRGLSGDVWVGLNDSNGGFASSQIWHGWFAPRNETPLPSAPRPAWSD